MSEPAAPLLEVMVMTDEDDNTWVVIMEKATGTQIPISAAAFLEMAELVCIALEGDELEDSPDETVIRLH